MYDKSPDISRCPRQGGGCTALKGNALSNICIYHRALVLRLKLKKQKQINKNKYIKNKLNTINTQNKGKNNKTKSKQTSKQNKTNKHTNKQTTTKLTKQQRQTECAVMEIYAINIKIREEKTKKNIMKDKTQSTRSSTNNVSAIPVDTVYDSHS